MFRTLKLVLVKKPVATETVLNLFSPSSLNVFETSRNYAVSKRNVGDEIQFSKLKDIEQLKGLEKHTFNTNSSQDVACRFILNKNITVPNLIGYTKATVSFNRSNSRKLPSVLSFGRFDAEEDNIIVENLENLVKRAKMNSIGEVLDVALALSDENRVTRIEIIGSYLSQGLQKIRLPQVVFNRARKLLASPKGDFSEAEKRIIEESVNSCENFNDWSSLGRKLDRRSSSVKIYVEHQLRNKDKTRRGKFSAEESKKVMDHLFESNKKALFESENLGITSEVWVELANNLKRPDHYVYYHWFKVLQPILRRYEAGVLDVNFRIPLLEYCIINDIKYTQNANWVKISVEPEFVGTTPDYLSKIYRSIRNEAKRSIYKGRADHEVTTKALLEFQKTRKVQSKPSDKTQHKILEKEVLDYYENVIKMRLQ